MRLFCYMIGRSRLFLMWAMPIDHSRNKAKNFIIPVTLMMLKNEYTVVL